MTRNPLWLMALATGCMGPWDPAWSLANTASTGVTTDTSGTGDSSGTTDTNDSADTDDSADTGTSGTVIEVTEDILGDTVWSAENTDVIRDLLFVEGGLAIPAGTRVEFENGVNGAGIVVTREGNLIARGTESDPIVFTSAKPKGERAPGDWGGIVLLGSAPTNQGANVRIEGIPETENRGLWGGSDDSSSCGVLEYVRIEFGGYKAFEDKELNGLTLGGCGSSTIIDHVQTHRIADDGVEIFGGTVDVRHLVVSRVADDGLDWDFGRTGRGQFIVVQQDPSLGNEGIEADNNEDGHDLLPRSAPTIYNLTLLGGGSTGAQPHRGMVLRRGTSTTLRNVLIAGMSSAGVEIKDTATTALIEDGTLSIDHAIFYDIADDAWGDDDASEDDDGGFSEPDWLAGAAPIGFEPEHILLGTDPLLPAAATDLTNPSFIPDAASPAADAPVATTPPDEEFWDRSATYVGAVRPGTSQSWLAGWTDFPDQ